MTVSRLIARPMLASMFVVGGVNALSNAPALGAKAEPGHRQARARWSRRVAPRRPIPRTR